MTKRITTTIENDTPILPGVVGEAVVRWVVGHLSKQGDDALAEDLYEHREEIGEAMAARANTIYQHDEKFRKKIRGRGNVGRDTLYVFTEYWFKGWAKDHMPKVYRALSAEYGWSFSPHLEALREQARRFRAAAKRVRRY